MDQGLQQASSSIITPLRERDNEPIDVLGSLFLVSIISLVDLYEGTMSAFFCTVVLLASRNPNLTSASDLMCKTKEFCGVTLAVDFLVDLYNVRKSYSPQQEESSSRLRCWRARDNQLVAYPLQENEKVKPFNRWKTVSQMFEFLYKIRKSCKEAKKDHATPSITKNWQNGKYLEGQAFGAVHQAFAAHQQRIRWNSPQGVSSHQENKWLKANRWKTVSLLFKFLYKIRKCCKESKKGHAIAALSIRPPISKNCLKVEDLGVGATVAVNETSAEHHYRIRRNNQSSFLMRDNAESARIKAFYRWKTISKLFEFLYKIRKAREETRKDCTVSSSRPLVIKSWQKGKYVGGGASGAVYEALADDASFFALKEVPLNNRGQAQETISHAEQEISLLSQLRHENIVRYLGSQKDDSKFYIFLELVAQGSLVNVYQDYMLSDSQCSTYTRDILKGLCYLHSQKVIHRDIKCANVLVDASGSVKLADFGLAKVTKLNDIKSCKGTPYWMAPEVVKQNNQGYGIAADIWSLGCTVLEMLTRQFPFSNLEPNQALFRIGRGEVPPIPGNLTVDARDFVLKCLRVNPDDRPSAAQLLEHPFVNKSSPCPLF